MSFGSNFQPKKTLRLHYRRKQGLGRKDGSYLLAVMRAFPQSASASLLRVVLQNSKVVQLIVWGYNPNAADKASKWKLGR